MLLHKWGQFRYPFQIARYPQEAARRCWVRVAEVNAQMAFQVMTLGVDAGRCLLIRTVVIARHTILGGAVDQSDF